MNGCASRRGALGVIAVAVSLMAARAARAEHYDVLAENEEKISSYGDIL
ncbi:MULTISPECIES: hypothetical protein [Bradyrhizobium]|nr:MULTISPECIES: hypothetical protein [Bradyrhizobium]